MNTLLRIALDTLLMLGVLVVVASVVTQGAGGLLVVALIAPVAWAFGALARRVWGLVYAR